MDIEKMKSEIIFRIKDCLIENGWEDGKQIDIELSEEEKKYFIYKKFLSIALKKEFYIADVEIHEQSIKVQLEFLKLDFLCDYLNRVECSTIINLDRNENSDSVEIKRSEEEIDREISLISVMQEEAKKKLYFSAREKYESLELCKDKSFDIVLEYVLNMNNDWFDIKDAFMNFMSIIVKFNDSECMHSPVIG